MRASLARRRDEDEFEQWLERALERADPFMAWLGVLFALLVGYELAVEVSSGASRVLTVAGWMIWGSFLLEFLAQLYVAPRRLRHLRRHWFQALGLVVPTLRFLRFVRLLRLGRALPAARVVSSSYRAAGTARRLLRTRLAYLVGVSAVIAIAVAELAFLFERDAADPAFVSFGDAVLWALTAVIALQGDPTPTSVGGRLAMLAGFTWGLVVVATLAGSLGAFLVDERRERAEAEAPRSEDLWPR
jgi:voltage-gated potassium channel